MSVSTLSWNLSKKTGLQQFLKLFHLHLSRSLTTEQLSSTITYITNSEPPNRGSTSNSKQSSWDFPTNRPLSILICWLMAKNGHVNKYVNFYLDKGYDVLTIRVTIADASIPTRMDRIVKEELMPLLRRSNHSKSIIHGFSVGSYVFSQMLRVAKENPEEYGPILNKVVAQIWDSAARGIAVGLSKSVFPDSLVPQLLLKKYLEFHTKVMHEVFTKHYIIAEDRFVNSPLPAPALLLNYRNDLISPMTYVQAIQNTWETQRKIPVTIKIWEDTSHVGHMQKYPDEYKEIVTQFLAKILD